MAESDYTTVEVPLVDLKGETTNGRFRRARQAVLLVRCNSCRSLMIRSDITAHEFWHLTVDESFERLGTPGPKV